METLQNVLTRRSAIRLASPAPSDEELLRLVAAAMTAPDHGRLLPWHLLTLRGVAREKLGQTYASCAGRDVNLRRRAAAKPLRAPLLIAIVFSPVEHPKIPEWEQLAATVAAVHTLALLLHDRGYGCIWRTGEVLEDEGVRSLHEVKPGERLLGWLYTGTAIDTPPSRPSPDAQSRLRAL
ncbi:nitroreductase [Streptomyces durbertensis]|uniref:Putative NAD(P)H nitroreductase n=1 Tax=Streptomyces durbertensis TaxID=2448886 RepID=A0ABR6EI08_9ACTN|nr:nitroreductase [Streptomyces durbertensis]MBB1244966.1 nitroreductase [Streptomyces durbertensis]